MNRQLPMALRAPNPFSMVGIPDPDQRVEEEPASREGAPSGPNPIASLSPRRLAVLELVARGLTNREIANVLGISTNTVKAHLTGVLETLDLTNRTEAAMAFQEFEFEHPDTSS